MSESGESKVPTVAGSAASVGATGTATAPGAGTTLATVNAPVTGTYQVTAWGHYGVTGDTAGNMRVQVNGVTFTALPVQGSANGVPVPVTFTALLTAGQAVAVQNIAAGAAGCVYLAGVILTRVQ